MEEFPHRHVTRVSACGRLHLLCWLPALGTSLYYACVHMFARTHLCVGTVSLLTCLRSLQRGNMAASSLHPQCRTWHSVLEQGCPGKQERHHGDGMFVPFKEETAASQEVERRPGGVRGALQARETTHERARVLCWPVPRSHRHPVQPGGDLSKPWWGSKRPCTHVTSWQRLLSRCPVTETPIFGGGVHWGTLYNCELSNFHFQRHSHHQYSSPKRTIQTQPTS